MENIKVYKVLFAVLIGLAFGAWMVTLFTDFSNRPRATGKSVYVGPKTPDTPEAGNAANAPEVPPAELGTSSTAPAPSPDSAETSAPEPVPSPAPEEEPRPAPSPPPTVPAPDFDDLPPSNTP